MAGELIIWALSAAVVTAVLTVSSWRLAGLFKVDAAPVGGILILFVSLPSAVASIFLLGTCAGLYLGGRP